MSGALAITMALLVGTGAYEALYGPQKWRPPLGLALIAVALWLAYAAGGQQ